MQLTSRYGHGQETSSAASAVASRRDAVCAAVRFDAAGCGDGAARGGRRNAAAPLADASAPARVALSGQRAVGVCVGVCRTRFGDSIRPGLPFAQVWRCRPAARSGDRLARVGAAGGVSEPFAADGGRARGGAVIGATWKGA
eukprot:ctg_528.g250